MPQLREKLPQRKVGIIYRASPLVPHFLSSILAIRFTERARLNRCAQLYDRYEQVVALRAQGLGSTEIAQRVGLSPRTIQGWLKEDAFPEAQRRRKRRSSFDPYAAYVFTRWEEGEHNGRAKFPLLRQRDLHAL